MTDATLFADGEIDLVTNETDLEVDDGLSTAVLISLFSDARASDDRTVPIADQDLRGWWGEETGEAFGSLLWLLAREKETPETLARARSAARDALQWLVNGGIAREVRVDASYPRRGFLELDITIVRGTSTRWARLWEATREQVRASGSFGFTLSLE